MSMAKVKMLRLLTLLLVTDAALVLGELKAKRLPSYILPCSRTDPNLSKCFLINGRKAISTVLKGDPAYKLRSFLPFHLEKADFSPNDNLRLILKDADLHGLDTIDLINVDVDLERRHVSFDLHSKLLTLLAKYTISGQILVVPISGSGFSKIEFSDSDLNFSYDYDLMTKSDGKRYVANVKPQVNCKINKAHYQFDNLFNGNKLLADNVNKILNDNYKEVLNDFEPIIKEVITLIGSEIVKAYITTVPYDDLFLS